MFNLGVLYLKGQGVEAEFERGVRFIMASLIAAETLITENAKSTLICNDYPSPSPPLDPYTLSPIKTLLP